MAILSLIKIWKKMAVNFDRCAHLIRVHSDAMSIIPSGGKNHHEIDFFLGGGGG